MLFWRNCDPEGRCTIQSQLRDRDSLLWLVHHPMLQHGRTHLCCSQSQWWRESGVFSCHQKYFYRRVWILQTEIDDLNSKSIVWEGAFCSGQSYKFCLEFSYDNKTDDDFTDFCQVPGCFNNLSVLQVVVPSVKVCW